MEGIGLVGLGAMGAGMARNILTRTGALHTVAHRNRAVIDALVQDGAVEHPDAADLAQACDILLLCLPNSEVVEQTITRLRPALRPGHVVVDTGTSALRSTLEISRVLGEMDVQFAEAPLTGGARQAADAQLGALVGASSGTFARIEPVLSLFCSTVKHFGPVGAGAQAKFINNYMVMGIAALVAEAFHAAAESGIDWGDLYDVVECGSASSGVLQRIIGNARHGDFSGYVFSVANAAKDMRYIGEFLGDAGHATPLSEAVNDFFQRADRQGHGALRLSELLRPEIRTQLLPRNG